MIYIGYDTREDTAYRVAKHSASNHMVTPLIQTALRSSGCYWREPDKLASTEFSLTRFLVPYLNNYKGWALFIDCDVLFLEDPQNLFDLADNKYAMMCVKHNYNPHTTIKMDGKQQHLYPRKNWSSVMLFNCCHPSNLKLTPQLINTETPAYLHRMSWLRDSEIGELPLAWNYLVGWYNEQEHGKPKLLHYTEGGPWFENYKDCEYADEWTRAYENFNLSSTYR
jgi:lipopolysaccharide biosynthesis glycosyltransferase